MNRWKNRLKKGFVVILAASLIGNVVDWSVLQADAEEAEKGKVLEEKQLESGIKSVSWNEVETVTEGNAELWTEGISFYSLDDGIIELKNTNEIRWIDRVDTTGVDVAIDFYNNLEEGTDNDGINDYFIEDAYNTQNLVVAEFTGSAASYDEAKAEAAAMRDYYRKYMKMALDAFVHDHPEVFWLGDFDCDTRTTYSYPADGTCSYEVVMERKMQNMCAQGYRSESVIKAAILQRDTAVNEIVNATAGKSDYEKLKYFNEKLLKINEYNTSGSLSGLGRECKECISALTGSKGTNGPIGKGYAKAFKVLCDKVGIPCVLVSGKAKPAASELSKEHMWNYVQLEGSWYGVDVAWNDQVIGNVDSEMWFLAGEEAPIRGLSFIESHPVSNQVSSGRVAFTNGPVLSKTSYIRPDAVTTVSIDDKLTYYTYVSDAFQSIGSHQSVEITLMQDIVDVDSGESVHIGSTYGTDANVTFDLNGHNITGTTSNLLVRGSGKPYTLRIVGDGQLKTTGAFAIDSYVEGPVIVSGNVSVESRDIAISVSGQVMIVDNASITSANDVTEDDNLGYAGVINADNGIRIYGGSITNTSTGVVLCAFGDEIVIYEGSFSGSGPICGSYGTYCNIDPKIPVNYNGQPGYYKLELEVEEGKAAGTFLNHKNFEGTEYGEAGVAIQLTVTAEDGYSIADAMEIKDSDGNVITEAVVTKTSGEYGTEGNTCVFVFTMPEKVSTITVPIQQMNSNQTQGSIANKTDATGYATQYEYKDVIPVPTEENFQRNNEAADVSFAWYEGDFTADGTTPDAGKMLHGMPENAGSYTLIVTMAEQGNYTAAETRLLVEISRVNPVAEDLVYTAPVEKTYNGTAKAAQVAAADTTKGLGVITLWYQSQGSTEWTQEPPVNAGSYLTAVTIAEGQNYNAVNTPMELGEAFTIEPKNLTEDMVTGINSSYYFTNAEINPVPVVEDGSVLELNKDYTMTVANNIEVYRMRNSDSPRVDIVGIGNYQGSVSRSFGIEYYPLPDGSIYYNNSNVRSERYTEAVVITAPGYQMAETLTGAYEDSFIIEGEGMIDKTLYFRQKDTGYLTVPQEITVNIDTQERTLPNVTAPRLTGVYGQAVEEMTLSGGSAEVAGQWQLVDSNKEDIPNAGTTEREYEVAFIPEDSENYGMVIKKVRAVVAPKSLEDGQGITISQAEGIYTYTGNAIMPSVIIAAGEAVQGIKISDSEAILTENDYTVEYAQNIAAYTVAYHEAAFDAQAAPVITITGQGNYTGAVTRYFVIHKAENAPNMPENVMNVAHSCETVGAIGLPAQWEWQAADEDRVLPIGEAVSALAVYTGSDRENYENVSVTISITRAEGESAEDEMPDAEQSQPEEEMPDAEQPQEDEIPDAEEPQPEETIPDTEQPQPENEIWNAGNDEGVSESAAGMPENIKSPKTGEDVLYFEDIKKMVMVLMMGAVLCIVGILKNAKNFRKK